jgi:Transcriptional regulatory protein, C terminal
MERHATFTFGEKFGEPFRLEARLDPRGRLHLTLFRGFDEVRNLLNPTLELLRYMAERHNKELLEADILKALWPSASPDIIDTHVHSLRKALLEDDPKNPRFIETLPKRGYRFLPKVLREGDLGGIEVFGEWNRARFYELLGSVERGPEHDHDDLRIVTTGFNQGISELDLTGLLRRHVRVKILMMNPENDALISARYSLRKDKPKPRALRELREQIAEIESLSKKYPPATSGEPKGMLELRLSDIMPAGFMVHSREWALLGVFLAHDTYAAGPMLEIRSDIELWERLRADWDARWKVAHNPTRKKDRAG